MTKVRAGEQVYDVDVVVFDKDGLLFDSQYFWKGLARARLEQLEQTGFDFVEEWCELFGIHIEQGEITSVDPYGIFALASPQEEIVITASLIHKHKRSDWGVCRKQAIDVFEKSDRAFDLLAALRPKLGFPEIFHKLRIASVPYGIATSDDDERTRASIQAFDRLEYLEFIITPVDVKQGKPNPDMLHLIAERTGAAMDRIMMIGDSVVDVLMAKQAGCIGIGIPDDDRMKQQMKPHASSIISSLAEIDVV